MSTSATPVAKPAWPKSPWQLSPQEEAIVADWRDVKQLRLQLDGLNVIWAGAVFVAVPLVMLVFAIGVNFLIQLLGGEGFIIDEDRTIGLTFPTLVTLVVGVVFHSLRQHIAALKYIGQLKERLAELEPPPSGVSPVSTITAERGASAP
jgi:hypothetical protein